MRRGDSLRALDIAESIDRIQGWVEKGLPASDVTLFRSAVLRELSIIGEAVVHLSGELKAGHPGIPWPSIAGFRNKIVHEYWDTAWRIVEQTINEHLPPLKSAVAPIAVTRDVPDVDVSEEQLFAAATKISLMEKQGQSLARVSGKRCGDWMPIARARCNLPAGHKGHHRS